jgi:hypothetical protein
MFLTNSMLADKGISNGSIGVITNILDNKDIETAFPTRDGIQVQSLHTFCLHLQKLNLPRYSNCTGPRQRSIPTELNIDDGSYHF